MASRKTSKPKSRAGRRSIRAVVRDCSEERILQLSNDLSENIASGDVKDWRSVAAYWRKEYDKAELELERVQTAIAGVCLGQAMDRAGTSELQDWLDRRNAPNKEITQL